MGRKVEHVVRSGARPHHSMCAGSHHRTPESGNLLVGEASKENSA